MERSPRSGRGRFPPIRLTKYPHMSTEDTIIWNRFLEAYGREYDSFDYDIKVGEGEAPRPTLPDNYKKMVRDLTRKRIDAVGYKPGEIHIFEVKPFAKLSALGQILAYAELYTDTFTFSDTLRAAVVCENVDSDLKKVLTKYNVTVILV